MGCITSTQPKKIQNAGIKSHTEIMLNRSSTLNDQLRIIIDDDKYKQIEQNTTKYSSLDREHSSTISSSHTHSVSSTAESTTSTQCTNEFSVSHSTLQHQIIKPIQSQYVSSINEPSMAPNLVTFKSGNGGVTMMGFASNETDNSDNNDNNNIEESVTISKSDSEPSLIPVRTVTLMGIASNDEVFVSTNTDLNNINPNLSNYRSKKKEEEEDDTIIKQEIATPGSC